MVVSVPVVESRIESPDAQPRVNAEPSTGVAVPAAPDDLNGPTGTPSVNMTIGTEAITLPLSRHRRYTPVAPPAEPEARRVKLPG